MSHRLRRIIGINICNPRDRIPSGQICELNPTVNVLAVGVNGVGKSSFLRLLPLFYGATPQQILRGTGLTSMVSHTLGDASSAVAFEYERESESDLRCVVMHCAPNEEAPEFRIITGGYEERFFLNEREEFIPRESFGAWVRELGFQVSEKLLLNEYRCVILNDRPLTRKSVKLRELAAKHSLGPKPLKNLDQIAAAMATEKISFKDLLNIVIDRVSDATEGGVDDRNSKKIKKKRSDVTDWLDSCSHLSEVMTKKNEASAIGLKVKEMKEVHSKLCSLYVSVKTGMEVIVEEKKSLDLRETNAKNEFALADESYKKDVVNLEMQKESDRSALESKRAEMKSAENRAQHFSSIDIESLVVAVDSEDTINDELHSVSVELERLNSASGGVSKRIEESHAELSSRYTQQLLAISSKKLEVTQEANERRQGISNEERLKLSGIEKSKRLVDIASSRDKLNLDLGELIGRIKNPVANDETLHWLSDARKKAGDSRSELKKASVITASVKGAMEEEKRLLAGMVDHQERKRGDIVALDERIEGLKVKLDPPKDSLLAFLRNTDANLWEGLAKVIRPELLVRNDLQPDVEEALYEGDGKTQVDRLALNVSSISTPDWVEMQSVRSSILTLEKEREDLLAEVLAMDAKIKKKGLQVEAKKKDLDEAEAKESVWRQILEKQESEIPHLERSVESEKVVDRQKSEAKQKEKLSELAKLSIEEQSILGEEIASKLRIQENFKAQRDSVDRDEADGLERLELEQESAEEALKRDKQQVDIEGKRELEGLGVDTQRISELIDLKGRLGEKLTMIAKHRHNVAEWKVFKRDVIDRWPLIQELEVGLKKAAEISLKRFTDFNNAYERLCNDYGFELKRIEESRKKRDGEYEQLSGVMKDVLFNFVGFGHGLPYSEFNPSALVSDARKTFSQLEGHERDLERMNRSLRNVMTQRNGQIADWLDIREKELPEKERVLSHLYVCLQAEALTDWFEPDNHVPYVDQIHREMSGFLSIANNFVTDIELFERKVDQFDKELKLALSKTEKFERFKDLGVDVKSGLGQIGALKLLRSMRDVANSQTSSLRSFMTQERELPSKEHVEMMRSFREILPSEGVLKVNLTEYIKLEFSLTENGAKRVISNEVEFSAVSSNGLTALITAMFLMGFVQMIRGDSEVRLTWITDEIGRFDGNNLRSFLQTLDKQNIDVISAAPSVDPALARFYKRIAIFEDDGSIGTSEEKNRVEVEHVPA